jgi:hypothetical protein
VVSFPDWCGLLKDLSRGKEDQFQKVIEIQEFVTLPVTIVGRVYGKILFR